MNDFQMMVKQASKGGLTTLNQLRVFLWLGRVREAVTARQCADGTGVTQPQCNGIFKALEDQGHVTIEVRVMFVMGVRRSVLVADLTPRGVLWLAMIHEEEAAA